MKEILFGLIVFIFAIAILIFGYWIMSVIVIWLLAELNIVDWRGKELVVAIALIVIRSIINRR